MTFKITNHCFIETWKGQQGRTKGGFRHITLLQFFLHLIFRRLSIQCSFSIVLFKLKDKLDFLPEDRTPCLVRIPTRKNLWPRLRLRMDEGKTQTTAVTTKTSMWIPPTTVLDESFITFTNNLSITNKYYCPMEMNSCTKGCRT